MLTGARQTGKTTLAKRKYKDLKYINLDAPENREAMEKLNTAAWGKDIGNAVIDEAQKVPEVFEKIKYAYDEDLISFQFLLGSSQVLLLKKIRESLAGRISIYEMWPLMMSEICRQADEADIPLPLIDHIFSGEKIDHIFKDVPSFLLGEEESLREEAEKHLLHWGGMPALLPFNEEERWQWLKDYEYTYLERDLADLARLDDLQPFRKFQKLSALRSAQLLNYSELARDASLSVDSARRYLEYLRLSYQVVLVQPFYENITSSVIKTPKLYWTDVGLLRQLAGFKGEYSGQIYETMVVGECIKWIRTTKKDSEIFFYRTRSGLELDLLLETPKGIIGFEIKSRRELVVSDIKSMKEVASKLGARWQGGIVVYQGREIKKLSDPHIWAVPSRRLFV